jgi:DNA-binding SARP family transcriptional activator/DNA-binding XRE family transcriptional regulator
MTNDPRSFGEMLRTSRVSTGLTQQELGERAGVSVRGVRDIEHGRVRRPRDESVRRLAKVLGLDPAEALALSRRGAPGSTRPAVRPPDLLDVAVLGPLRVKRGGKQVPLGSLKERCLLGLLALNADRVVAHQEIVDALWGERPPAAYRNLIHTYVARLRRVLAPGDAPTSMSAITAVRGGYQLRADGTRLDLTWFDESATRARDLRATDPPAALELYATALGAWRGPVLADLTDWLQHHPTAIAAAHRRLTVALACADLALGLGRFEQALAALQPLSDDHPLDEGLHARLMLALAGAGRQASALELYTDLRRRLADELGLEPGAELRDAQTRVLREDIPTAVLAPAATRPAQLPPDVAGFTGRAAQLERLDTLLPPDVGATDPAVVVTTITGMAGVGKTALAVHWGHRVASRFDGGQLYVNLQGYSLGPPLDPLETLTNLLHGLGVGAGRIPADLEPAAALYRSLLAGKRTLLVLDNALTADQVRPLLPGHPGSMVIVTSRDQLTGLIATHGAHQLALDVLILDEAMALLAEVLGAARVAAEPAAAAELAQLCGLLPLPLRIAAANLTIHTEPSLASSVAALRSGNRLASLAVNSDRQAAVRIAFDHSYQHLSPDARRLFRLLGLVPGPDIAVPAVAALADRPPEVVTELLDTLLSAHLVEPRGASRIGQHELLRLYARERADRDDSQPERDSAVRRLLDWYLRAIDAAALRLYPDVLRLALPPASGGASPRFERPAQAMAWLDAERSNLVAIVRHAAEQRLEPNAWLLADALRGYFWLRRHIHDWRHVAEAGLAAATAGGDDRAQAACHLSLGHAEAAIGRFLAAAGHYKTALSLAGRADWIDGQAACLAELGLAYWSVGDLEQAADHQRRALALYRRSGRLGGQASALLQLGVTYRYMGRLPEAFGQEQQALTLYRQLGSRQGEALALGNLGIGDYDLGRMDRAYQRLTTSLALHEEVGNRFGQAYIGFAIAAVQRDTGIYPEALASAEAALRLAAEIGHPLIESAAGTTLASVHLCLGHHELARDHYQRALDLARQTAIRAPAAEALLGLAAVCQQTGRVQQAAELAEQARKIASQAGLRVMEGQALTSLTAAHHDLGYHDKAREYAEQALNLQVRTGHRAGQADALRVLGALLRDAGDLTGARLRWREAVRLLSDLGSPYAEVLREQLETG